MRPKVLIVGKDAQLLDTRRMLITDAGFEVNSATSVSAITADGAENVAVVVLCHTLSRDEKRHAIASIKASSRRAMIVHMLKDNSTDELPEHASFRVYDGPVQLVSTVRDLVNRWESGVV